MKLLVTVGTTRFDSLIEAVEKSRFLSEHQVKVQCANGQKSITYDCSEFIESIDDAYKEADWVITHAGAGSVFRLLELGARILVVPNLERDDNHQVELARYIDEKQHGLVCDDLANFDEVLAKTNSFQPVPYLPSEFHAAQEITAWIADIYQ